MDSSRVRKIAAAAAVAVAMAIVSAAALGAASPAFAVSPVAIQFTSTGAVQTWSVPTGVTKITVDLAGGQGGASYGGGGVGAELTGTLSVTPGSTLNIVVGGYGSNGREYSLGAGGGGGSFIYTTADTSGILAAAGGGGGQASNDFATSGSTGTSGLPGKNGGAGGTNGSGGVAGTAGGGGGLLTDGTSNSGGGGRSLANGAAGGSGSSAGAFGGGGGTSDPAGGGGGGYSGGGGGAYTGPNGGGGGGGSFFGGSLASAGNYGGGGPGFVKISYVVPTITAVTPATGPAGGGTAVTITGTGFTGAQAVDFGSVAASSFTVVSDTSITAVTPSSTKGPVDVTVVGASGPSATATGAFTYLAAPALPTTGIDASTGLLSGGALLLAGLIISAFTRVRRRRPLPAG
jgi:hypothetical protein